VAVFAAFWGVKLTRDEGGEAQPEAVADGVSPGGPGIAEMAALARPAGNDTLAASLAIIKRMQEGGGG
jgi:hypothetical protein